ncbi:MAG: glycosyltransferase family 4 protein [DPANN group archaeon]|nr:glycosyltransferase family 4 protein [DPANN group archaeon]
MTTKEKRKPGKKRLLIATDAFLPRWDGIARFLHEVIPGLKEHFDITVLAPAFPEYSDHEDKEEGYTIIRLPTFGFRVGDYHPPKYHCRAVREEVKKTDIVWTQAIMPIGKLAIWYGRRYDKEVIATIHSYEWELAMNALSRWNILRYPLHGITKMIANLLYNRCSLLLVPNKETAEILSFNHITVPKKVVNLGVDIRRFRPPRSKAKAKQLLGLDPEKLVIGYAGRLGREKDLETLFRSFRKLRKEHDHIHLLIGGKGVRGYETLFADRPDVTFLGETDEIQTYYQAMDIYVLPSLTETTSLSTMEAMACGVPAVTTKVGYVKRYVKERVNGFFFPKQNSAVLSLRLETLIKNSVMREAMSQLARKTMVDNYSWDRTKREIRDIFLRRSPIEKRAEQER